jgi:outer membrane lipoprotein-sorting protein
VTPPPAEFKDAKTQVIKSPLSSKQIQTQGLLRILNEGGVLKHFSAGGVLKEGEALTFFLQPKTQSEELRRLQIKINSSEKTIAGLRYWDSLDNETVYDFSKIKFNGKLDKSLFTYKPPKNADVVTP